MVTVLLVGIPHGAVDHLIERRNADNLNKRFITGVFLVKYISLLLIYAILWQFPVPAFVIFMLISAYHFGETDLFDLKLTSAITPFFYLFYGIMVIAFLLLSHFDETIPFINMLGFNYDRFKGLLEYVSANTVSIRVLTVLFFFLFYFLMEYKRKRKPELIRMLEILTHLVLVAILPLLLAFAYYFGVWHSLLSIRNIYSHLGGDRLIKKKFFGQVLILTVSACVIITIAGYFYLRIYTPEGLAGTIFIGLAILTLPHMQVMHTMYQQLKNKVA
jgi:Brp/Blh family beta-carotene 15,15'-monooxygenase